MRIDNSNVTYSLCVLAIFAIAYAVEVVTLGWLPGWFTLLAFIVSPVIGDIVSTLSGKSNEVMAFMIFATVIYGGPALVLYGLCKFLLAW